ncbi:hypothetical protein [Terricaulis silvestris]|uniref:Uncharacterized protein n=1 Tax=Terricaulis silvestris TaxID=2686094 RepID=A0A6I6MK28_9CAUL|nr:hypothetical protein [Terricaulis silvestris]QGZ94281.1 hypothetical protein DSM104635_01097 [Terricaulis silvestris]
MLTCLALMLNVSLAELPSLATEVEAEARTLTAQTEITPAFLTEIVEFSGDAERLSVALRAAGVEQDLPCIFHGIAEDARERAAEFQSADDQAERDAAFMNLRVLLDDAILIAPMAASAAADRAAEQAVAQR